MFDPMLTLLAAKAKAVGLVAGTAMVTTALVGGGAVAMTAVSSESEVQDSAVVAEELAADPTLVDEVVSDTSTVGIGDEDEDQEAGEEKVRPPLPEDFVCDETKNHGQNVSAYAKSLEKGPGRGEKVSAVAQSDCGKTGGDEEEAELEAESTGTEETQDAAKAEQKAEKKAAKAERKAAKKAAQAEKRSAKKSAQADKKAGKGGGKN